MKVLCIGHASYDISLPVENYPIENTKYRLEEKIESGGGPACTVAYLLGKWGADVSFEGLIGEDVYGNRIITELTEANVNIDNIERTKEDTSLSFVLINKKNGSRTLFNCGKKQNEPTKSEYNFLPDIIYLDGMYYNHSKQVLERYPSAIKVIDAGRITKELLDLCNYVDYIVCSKGFAETATATRIDFKDKDTLATVYNKLEILYPKAKIVVTLEEHGCMYKLHDKVKLMTGIKVKEVDTTGAGDVFHGAFVYALTQELSLEKCCKIANIAGGLSVRYIGSRMSVPEINEVYEIYRKNK